MCITKEQYEALMAEQKETQSQIKELKVLIVGNGTPEKGMAWKLSFLSRVVEDHLAFHKGVQAKIWDTIGKPIITEVVKLGLTSGIFYLIIEAVLSQTH